MQKIRKWLGALVFGAALTIGAFSVANAQPQGLPTAPALIAGYGGSPLESWLILWLLPVSGLLAAIAAVTVDRGAGARRI